VPLDGGDSARIPVDANVTLSTMPTLDPQVLQALLDLRSAAIA